MIIRIGKLQLRAYATILEKRTGICSQKDTREDKHALLIDFDNSSISTIINSLSSLQEKYKLPAIYIIASSKHSYHAYCFTARKFMEIVHILSDISEIDGSYFRLGIVRGYYTLRITSRKGDKFKLVKTLLSPYFNEISPNSLTVSEYLTSNKGKMRKGGKNAKR